MLRNCPARNYFRRVPVQALGIRNGKRDLKKECMSLTCLTGAEQFRLQLPPECGREQPGKEGRDLSIPAGAGLRWQRHAAGQCAEILELHGGHSATLLAKRWESLLVNVTTRLAACWPKSMEPMRLRVPQLNEILTSSKVGSRQEAKKRATTDPNKERAFERKRYKSKRKMIQEKLSSCHPCPCSCTWRHMGGAVQRQICGEGLGLPHRPPQL